MVGKGHANHARLEICKVVELHRSIEQGLADLLPSPCRNSVLQRTQRRGTHQLLVVEQAHHFVERTRKVNVPATHLSLREAAVLCGGKNRSRDDWCGVIAGGLPVVWQKGLEVAVFERRQTLKYLLEIGPWIVPVEFGRFDQAEHHGGALARLLRAHE